MQYQQKIKNYIECEIEILRRLDADAVNEVINVLEKAREREADIYIMGNGGSAATASHFAGDFNKGVYESTGGKKYKFHCLSDNVPTMMAVANDISYDEVFRFQLREILKKEDVVFGISGSGNSKNVLNAVEYAKQVGCDVIALTGYSGGKLKQMADYNIHVAIDDMQITEDIHMIMDHLMMAVLTRGDKKCALQ